VKKQDLRHEQDIFTKHGVKLTEEDIFEMKANIRTFFNLLQKWNTEADVTNNKNVVDVVSSKLQHQEGQK
jgi:flagellin-specific chaperone FliS